MTNPNTNPQETTNVGTASSYLIMSLPIIFAIIMIIWLYKLIPDKKMFWTFSAVNLFGSMLIPIVATKLVK